MSLLSEAFRGLQDADPAPGPKIVSAARPAIALEGTAKSVHPDFAPLKVYVRKSTRTAAQRKWEDETGKDMSDLVEHLLAKYLST